MKKLVLISLSITLLSATSNAQLEMDSSGDIKIGTHTGDPYYKLEVYGNSLFSCGTSSNGFYLVGTPSSPSLRPVSANTGYIGKSEAKLWVMYTNYMYYDHLVDYSDESIKENIETIRSPLFLLRQVRGVTYDLKKDYFANTPEDRMEKVVETGKNKYGVIAQELKEIFPDMVTFNEESGLYGVEYMSFIPVLIESIKEQQSQIESLQNQVNSLTSPSPEFKAASNNQEPILDQIDDTCTLFQNTPNPFSELTTIKYHLNEGVSSANIYIYNMTGKQLRSYDIDSAGIGEIQIHGGELEAGIYMYSLIADGVFVGTKQMLLTD